MDNEILDDDEHEIVTSILVHDDSTHAQFLDFERHRWMQRLQRQPMEGDNTYKLAYIQELEERLRRRNQQNAICTCCNNCLVWKTKMAAAGGDFKGKSMVDKQVQTDEQPKHRSGPSVFKLPEKVYNTPEKLRTPDKAKSKSVDPIVPFDLSSKAHAKKSRSRRPKKHSKKEKAVANDAKIPATLPSSTDYAKAQDSGQFYDAASCLPLNSSVQTPAKLLQECLNQLTEGIINPETSGANSQANHERVILIDNMCNAIANNDVQIHVGHEVSIGNTPYSLDDKKAVKSHKDNNKKMKKEKELANRATSKKDFDPTSCGASSTPEKKCSPKTKSRIDIGDTIANDFQINVVPEMVSVGNILFSAGGKKVIKSEKKDTANRATLAKKDIYPISCGPSSAPDKKCSAKTQSRIYQFAHIPRSTPGVGPSQRNRTPTTSALRTRLFDSCPSNRRNSGASRIDMEPIGVVTGVKMTRAARLRAGAIKAKLNLLKESYL